MIAHKFSVLDGASCICFAANALWTGFLTHGAWPGFLADIFLFCVCVWANYFPELQNDFKELSTLKNWLKLRVTYNFWID